MTTFPLLQLPLLAMENVLCMLSPFELIDVSLTSSRAKKVIKNFSRTKETFPVSFSNGQHSILFQQGRTTWSYGFEKISHIAYIHPFNTIMMLYQTTQIMKFSEEPLKDIMKWFDYAREVLNCKINSVTLDLGCCTNENMQTIDWIAEQSNTLDYLTILNDGQDSDDDLKYLMERINVLKSLQLMVQHYKDEFRMEIPGKPNRLLIGNSKFVDYDQLLRLKSPVIILRKSILTNEEINRFLRSWMSCETHLELKAFEINISGPEAMNEIMDLPHEKTNDPEIVWAFKEYLMVGYVDNEMYTIKRCDGKKRATVTVWYRTQWSLYMVVH
uniref:F-box domain-containing protein n=1 Tax=Caenorhabditis tropicalis TaxID=1561998 RepID=A0A1I7UU03_9PELO